MADRVTQEALMNIGRRYAEVLRREVDTRIEPHPFLTSDFTENSPIAREIMETGIRTL